MDYIIENEYLKTMKCFRETDKEKQLEQLSKLITVLEDKKLKKRIKRYISLYSLLPNETQLKQFKDEKKAKMLVEALQAKRDLQNYTEGVINGKKPYWQIIAEQNGWKKGESS